MSDLAVYFSLFVSAFIAATIFPMQSEAFLAGLVMQGSYKVWLLVLVASVGNVLGSVVNWLLGRGIERFRDKKWFPLKHRDLERAQKWYARYGRWSLLFSWLPVAGDALTLVAGVMREKLGVFIAFVTVAKTARYIVISYAALKLLGD